MSKYQYYVLCCRSANSQSLTGFLKYLPKNITLLVQNCGEFFCQNSFPATLRREKKLLTAI